MWQLWINTGTTILTFNNVHHPGHAQPWGEATQTKLDEIIRATKGARDTLIDLEDDDDAVIARLREELIKRKAL